MIFIVGNFVKLCSIKVGSMDTAFIIVETKPKPLHWRERQVNRFQTNAMQRNWFLWKKIHGTWYGWWKVYGNWLQLSKSQTNQFCRGVTLWTFFVIDQNAKKIDINWQRAYCSFFPGKTFIKKLVLCVLLNKGFPLRNLYGSCLSVQEKQFGLIARV